MRHGLAILAVLAAVVLPAAADDRAICAGSTRNVCNVAWLNANLHINDIQIVGTSDSYKLRPADGVMSLIRMGGEKDAQALDYGEPPLPDQLNAGARSLDFAVAYDPKGGLYKNPAAASMAFELVDDDYRQAMATPGYKVIHVFDVDYRSSCMTLNACLSQVAAWSRAHPTHMPIVITLHANDTRTPMPGATRPVAFDAAAMDGIDREVRAVFQPGEIITPDQVQAGYPTLREAVMAHHWPLLGAARGKVIFVLDDCAQKTALYRGDRHSLEGRTLFVTTDEASPVASFISVDDPRKDQPRIAADVKAGFIVKTRADDETVEARAGDTARRAAAFASGAQIVVTDFIMPDSRIGAYKVTPADDPHAVCEGGQCMSWAVLSGDAPPASSVQTAAR